MDTKDGLITSTLILLGAIILMIVMWKVSGEEPIDTSGSITAPDKCYSVTVEGAEQINGTKDTSRVVYGNIGGKSGVGVTPSTSNTTYYYIYLRGDNGCLMQFSIDSPDAFAAMTKMIGNEIKVEYSSGAGLFKNKYKWNGYALSNPIVIEKEAPNDTTEDETIPLEKEVNANE